MFQMDIKEDSKFLRFRIENDINLLIHNRKQSQRFRQSEAQVRSLLQMRATRRGLGVNVFLRYTTSPSKYF